MEEAGFTISKEQRQGFYEFIDSKYNQLARRITIAEMKIQEMRRDINSIKGPSYSFSDVERARERYYSSSWAHFFQEPNLRFDMMVTRKIVSKIYRPLALSTTAVSTVLAISIGVVASPILSVPFVLTALFSLYYWRLQGE